MFDYSADAIAETYPDTDPDGVAIFIEYVAGSVDYFDDLDSLIASYDDALIGNHYDSVADYAYEYAEDCLNLSNFALDYFDADKFGRDLEYGGDIVAVRDEATGLWLFNGHWG